MVERRRVWIEALRIERLATLVAQAIPGMGPVGRRVMIVAVLPGQAAPIATRSEEHTSELQSRENLVCRLLLEKKNSEDSTTAAATMSADATTSTTMTRRTSEG